MGAAEGGCCTPGALCHVARRDGCSHRRLRTLLGRFLWSCSKKASQTPKGNPLATVSHDPATTHPGTVSYRAERTCVSAQPSSADACNVGIRCSDDVMLQHIPRKGRRGRRRAGAVQPQAAANPLWALCHVARREGCNPPGCRPIPPHFFALAQRNGVEPQRKSALVRVQRTHRITQRQRD